VSARRKGEAHKDVEAKALAAAVVLAPLLGHRFTNPATLARALTHPSADGTPARNNQRLEFLGDRVLGLVIAQLVYRRFPAEPEGVLARRYNAVVRGETLARIARSLELGRHLVLGSSEVESGGHDKPAALANALEAVIAALYLDGGFETAERFIVERFEPRLVSKAPPSKDAKTALQEWAQARRHARPDYRIVRMAGEAHSPVFEVEVTIEGVRPARATGSSKREAEQAAAQALLERLDHDDRA
jgi:ribonuclease-3